MRGNAERRARFFRENPDCCFCGGVRPAVEEDHIPSRTLFTNRHWPEGYVFPACERCNRATSREELLVAFVARMRERNEASASIQEIDKYFADIPRYFPGLLQNMRPSHRDLRDARKRLGIVLPPGGASTDIPLLSVRDERIQNAVLNFGRKLGLALFYKNAHKIVPKGGGVAIRWYSNIQIETDQIPREIAQVLPQFPKLERSRNDLADQFFYRVGIADEGTMGSFLAMFRASFAILGFVSTDISAFQSLEHIPDASRSIFPVFP